MDPKEMQQVAAEFQKEMMRHDINMELMDIGPEPESELVDEEMDKVLMEVAGVKMSGMNWYVVWWIDIGLAGAHALPSQQADAARMSAALPDVPHYMCLFLIHNSTNTWFWIIVQGVLFKIILSCF